VTLALAAALAFVVLGVVAYILAHSLKAAQGRARALEAELADAEARRAATMAELTAREEDRHALEAELARLRLGNPGARLGASLDVLRDLSARSAASAPPDPVAGAPGPARDGD
jgi:type II secretory pathway pseudopilin PulG